MSALLDALGFVGNVLDTPGSILRGLMAGDPGKAFSGVLDPSQRVSGRDMLQRWGALGENEEGLDAGDVGGFLAEMITDPVNLLGVGALRGAVKADRLRALGPMHPGGAEKLLGTVPKVNQYGDIATPYAHVGEVLQRVDNLSPDIQRRFFGEIPPGSSYVGHGGEAVVFKTPDGDILRLVPEGQPLPPKVPQMRQPTRHSVYGEGGNEVTVQRLPEAQFPPRHTSARGVRGAGEFEDQMEIARRMRADIQEDFPGLDPYDVYPGNIGKINDDWVITDPSAIMWRNNQPPLPKLADPAPLKAMSPIIQAMAGHNVARTWPMMTNG